MAKTQPKQSLGVRSGTYKANVVSATREQRNGKLLFEARRITPIPTSIVREPILPSTGEKGQNIPVAGVSSAGAENNTVGSK